MWFGATVCQEHINRKIVGENIHWLEYPRKYRPIDPDAFGNFPIRPKERERVYYVTSDPEAIGRWTQARPLPVSSFPSS